VDVGGADVEKVRTPISFLALRSMGVLTSTIRCTSSKIFTNIEDKYIRDSFNIALILPIPECGHDANNGCSMRVPASGLLEIQI
jgi:hypothetical protein